MSKRNIRKCRFVNCKHSSKDIDIESESYVKDGSLYFHEDCYKLKKSNEWKDQQTRKDLTEFRNLWWKSISKTVNFSQLMRILNDYIARGVSSDYLLFALKYCINNHLNLNYPNGFKYYVDRQDIKQAYDKHLMLKASKKVSNIKITDKDNQSPTFNVNNKPKGFNSILHK